MYKHTKCLWQAKEGKIIMKLKTFSILWILIGTAYGSDLDATLQKLITEKNLQPLKPVIRSSSDVSRLGSILFHETELSGPRNISCAHCHHPRFGTSDAMPFSIGEGGQGVGGLRTQELGGVTKRHSAHLLNLGYPEIEHMFWDGRVFRDSVTGILQTPEPALNGENPLRADIANVLKSSLSAQAIFPIANDLEMKGQAGNDVADASGNLGAWVAVMKRLTEGPKSEAYLKAFQKAYPNTLDYNIGHVGEALGSFLKGSFNIINTPYDAYLKGNTSAMTPSEKRGLIVFVNRGKCIECHNGPHLSDFKFKTVGTPQVTSTRYKAPFDQGRFEVTGDKSDLFKFRTPALRHLALTAPYMHNGVFETLEQVIEHYNAPKQSLANYTTDLLNIQPYSAETFVKDEDPLRNKLRINLISVGEVRRGLNLTEAEKKDLLAFITTGLLDFRFQQNRN